MKKLSVSFLFGSICFTALAQFAPPAGQIGTTAMRNDSSAFVAWATGCTIIRGYQDISNTTIGYASVGDSTMALGIAGSNPVVSLGDGGSAVVTFATPIYNGPGWDFAVFENSFSDTYLELAFVEVSSDGINFFRFPATSNTQDTLQTGGFGLTDARKINNLAGKYRALYGTPFDLQELASNTGLNVNNITHIKIIDVVGCIQNVYATYDKNGNKINDPWSTPFASGGFDLDAIGVINQLTTGVPDHSLFISDCGVFPNPINEKSILHYYLSKSLRVKIQITDLTGREMIVVEDRQQEKGWQSVSFENIKLHNGIYLVQLITINGLLTKKIIIDND